MKLYKYYNFDLNKNFHDNFAPLIKKTLRYSSPILFNDLYDSKCVQKNLDGSFTYDFSDVISKHLQISCFSITPNSPIMWSHYANNHKGYIIEYELELDNLVKIDYRELKPRFFDTAEIRNKLIKKHPNISPASDEFFKLQEQYLLEEDKYQKILMDSIFIKHKDWEYEQEYRSIIVDEIGFKNHFTDKILQNSMIKSVILGYRFDKDEYIKELQDIKHKIFNNNLQIYKSFPKLDEYYMDIQKIKL